MYFIAPYKNMQHQMRRSHTQKKERGTAIFHKKQTDQQTNQNRATTTTSIPGSHLQKATILKQGLKTLISVATVLFSKTDNI